MGGHSADYHVKPTVNRIGSKLAEEDAMSVCSVIGVMSDALF